MNREKRQRYSEAILKRLLYELGGEFRESWPDAHNYIEEYQWALRDAVEDAIDSA